MAVNLSMLAGAGAQFFDNNGIPLSGGLVYTYAAGTNTPQATYTTSAGSIAHANPIVLDSAGRTPSGGEIWLTDAVAYKFVLKTAGASTIGTYDNVTGNASGIYAAFAASSGSSLVGYIQGSTGSVATTVQTKFRESVSVKDFGAVGNGTTDDSAAIQTALNSGAKVISFPTGTYLINTTLNLSTAGQKLVGQGGSLVKGTGAIESLYLMLGVDLPNLVFEDMQFTVKAGTVHTARGGFVGLTRCHFTQVNGCVFNAAIPGTTTQRESIESCLNTLSCNFLQITNNQFMYSWGNGCGANDSVGDGVNGNNITITGNLFYNVLDTGVGVWTNARNVTISNNVFYRKDFSQSSNGVHIDVAGGQNVTIDSNVITGNTLGVRILTNIGYTDQRVVVSNNVFEEQGVGSSEPPQCLKVSHDGAGGGENDFNFMVLGNTFSVQDNGRGIAMSSTGTTDVMTAKIDSNMFNLRGLSAIGVNFVAATNGNIKLSPGKNTFIGQGSGTLAVTGTFPSTIAINGGQENLAAYTNDFTVSVSTNTLMNSFYAGRGLYAMTGSIGARSGADSYVQMRPLGGSFMTNNKLLNAAAANTRFDNVWNFVNTESTYQFVYATGTASSTDFYYINAVRLI
jgi:hypothetical protein